jgi:hypothetical protein
MKARPGHAGGVDRAPVVRRGEGVSDDQNRDAGRGCDQQQAPPRGGSSYLGKGRLMNQHAKKSPAAPPETIYIIRHGEKPADPDPSGHRKAPDAPFGVDLEGKQSPHSLVPRGWQRAGGLVALFDPAIGGGKSGLQTPTALLSPVHGGPGKNAGHRTYQTIEGLGSRLGITIDSDFAVGQEAQLAASVVNDHSGVVLICWEHHHIPRIASALPVVRGTVIPSAWPKHRYDVVWTFTLAPDAATTQYAFGQIPQLLLSGDSDTVIPA